MRPTNPITGTPQFLEPRECFDRCIVGWFGRWSDPAPMVIYDYKACVKAWQELKGLNDVDAARTFDLYTAVQAQFGKEPILAHLDGLPDLEEYLATRHEAVW